MKKDKGARQQAGRVRLVLSKAGVFRVMRPCMPRFTIHYQNYLQWTSKLWLVIAGKKEKKLHFSV